MLGRQPAVRDTGLRAHAPSSADPGQRGGTTFTFVTDGIHSALDQAKAAAGDKNVDIAGGASTVQQYLGEGLIDELPLHVVPPPLGRRAAALRGTGRRSATS
ncbi:dihydrofolate reductase family protein [Streptomyces sp. NPDC054794]